MGYSMKLVILLGPPGVGKGTQCALLSSRLGFKHISTGAIIRAEIQSQSELGLRVKAIVESGNLVDDKTIFKCFERALNNLSSSSETVVLLDGLPRNLSQAKELDTFAQKSGVESVKVVCLNADTQALIRRFEMRYTCKNCGKIESISGAFDLSSFSCPSCEGVGTMMRRNDDEPETVRHRLELYQNETLPLVAFYKDKNIIQFVDGLMPPEVVYVKVASCLNNI